MRLIWFGENDGFELRPALEAAGFAVDAQPAPASTTEDVAVTARLAAALRAAEEACAGERPAAALVAGSGDPALAAALVAVKLDIPTAWLPTARAKEDELIGRVADLTLDASGDAEASALAVRELALPRLPEL